MLTRWTQRAAVIVPMAIAAIAALAAPLAHQDLPSHLRMGEWIIDHRAVPFTEPVAWTRAGEPYFAYSWLPQVVFAAAWRAAGAFGLHVVNALIVLVSGLAVMAFARAEGWTTARTSVVVSLHLGALALTVPSLRPQMILFITVPLVAAGVSRRMRGGSRLPAAATIIGASALAANSHLFFPITLAPLAWSFATGVPRRRLARFALPIFAGWLVSPYALKWIDVFRLNFAPNAMLERGSPIAEIAPGFGRIDVGLLVPFLVALALSATAFRSAFPMAREEPALVASPRRLRVAAAALMGVVTAMFAFAGRLIVAGWLGLLPFVSAGVAALERRHAARLPMLATAFLLVAVAWPPRWSHAREAGILRPGIAAPRDRSLGPLALHLRCSGRPLDDVRIFARFAEGSYLSWALSPARISVDTRTIFPDSVARPERAVMLSGDVSPLGPWRDAHLVILRADDPVLRVIHGDTAWASIAEVVALSGSPVRMRATWAVWARNDWLAASAPLPHASIPARAVDPRREPCPDARLIAEPSRQGRPR